MGLTLPNNLTVHFIGDPHLGKKFEAGVPLHRRGERERKQLQHFINELEVEADVIIIVGDLFDHPYVGYSVVDAAARALLSAAERNDNRRYYVMAGNHDLPRLITSVGAFHDLEQRLEGRYWNLRVVRRPLVEEGIAFFPWEWDRRADAQVKDVENEEAYLAVGHWDLSMFEGKDDHLAPVEELQRAFGPNVGIWSGHYHVPGEYTVKGVKIECTGSLEPYSHDQDPSGALYVTLPLNRILEAPASEFKDKCVRVILKPGEELPDLDCLALTHKREANEKVIRETTTSLRDFDWNKVLKERIDRLDPLVQAFIKERLHYDEQHGSSDQADGPSEADGDASAVGDQPSPTLG